MTTAPIFNFTDTWNDAGVTYSAIKVSITDTASAADSKLIDFEVGGVSQASIGKDGGIICKGLTSSLNIDLQGNRLVMDADNDTYLEASTDDRLDFVVGGTLVARFDANAVDTFQLDGVGFSPTGAVVGQALGYPNSAETLEPYTPAGGGDLLAAANETVTGNWVYTGSPDFSAATISRASREAFKVFDTAVADYTALKALTAGDYTIVQVADANRGGLFAWRAGNQSAQITSDPGEGVWVPPSSDATGAAGAWQRLHEGVGNVLWFGAVADGDLSDDTAGTDDTPAFMRALALFDSVYAPSGRIYRINQQLVVPRFTRLWSEPQYNGVRWTESSGWNTSNGAILAITHGSGGDAAADAGITIDDRSQIDGFCIVYPGQDMNPSGLDTAASPGGVGAPTEYPPTIAGPTGPNTAFICTLKNLYMPNSYIGFSFDGEGSDHYIEDVRGYFIYKFGVFDGHQNPPRLRRIIDSNGFAYAENPRPSNSLDRWSQINGIGVEIGSVDWMSLREVYIFRKSVAFDFVEGTGGDAVAASNTTFTDCQNDECLIGFRTTSQPRGTRIVNHTSAVGNKYNSGFVGSHFSWSTSLHGDIQTSSCEFRGGRVGTITGATSLKMSFKSNTGATFTPTDDILLFDNCTNISVDCDMDGAANTRGVRFTNGCRRININGVFHQFSEFDVVLEDGTGNTEDYQVSIVSSQSSEDSFSNTVASPNGTATVTGSDSTEGWFAGILAGGQANTIDDLSARSVSGLEDGDVVQISDATRGGLFAWRAGNQSANILGGIKTVSAGSAGDDTITVTGHSYFTGYKVITGATSVAGVSAATEYYVTRVDANTLQLHTSLANLNAGTAVDITSATTTGLTVTALKDPAQGEWVAPNSDLTGASGAWQRLISDYYSVTFFGAVGDDSTDNTEAISNAISTLQQKDSRERSLFFPKGIYRISGATAPMVGNGWNVFGVGNQGSQIFCSADAPILQLDTRVFGSSFFRLDGMYLRGSDSGSDTASAGLKVLATTSSATGASYARITNNYVTGVRVAFDFEDTGKRLWSGDPTLSAHNYLYFTGNNVTPTLACKYGLWFRGAGPADGSQILGNTLRGTVVALKMGTGATDHSLGDTLIQGNHLNGIGDASSLCFELIGPAASGGGSNPNDGNYNQLLNMVNNQMETTHSTKCGQFTNLQNWNFVANSFDPNKPPVLTDCNSYNYTGEGLLETDTVNTGAFNASGTATFSSTADFNSAIDTTGGFIQDTNGTRYSGEVIARRTVDNSFSRILGGSTGGSRLELFGPTHATTPNETFLSSARTRIRSADGATTFVDINSTANRTIIGSGAWDGHRLALGAYQLWVDATGDLRIKNGSPTSDTDGTVVGTQT